MTGLWPISLGNLTWHGLTHLDDEATGDEAGPVECRPPGFHALVPSCRDGILTCATSPYWGSQGRLGLDTYEPRPTEPSQNAPSLSEALLESRRGSSSHHGHRNRSLPSCPRPGTVLTGPPQTPWEGRRHRGSLHTSTGLPSPHLSH